jgi:hypothetical protein
MPCALADILARTIAWSIVTVFGNNIWHHHLQPVDVHHHHHTLAAMYWRLLPAVVRVAACDAFHNNKGTPFNALTPQHKL